MFDIPHITIGILVAVFPFFTITETPQATATESATTAVTPATSASPVFRAPPAEELAKITHATIRLELLQMTSVDQLARSASN